MVACCFSRAARTTSAEASVKRRNYEAGLSRAKARAKRERKQKEAARRVAAELVADRAALVAATAAKPDILAGVDEGFREFQGVGSVECVAAPAFEPRRCPVPSPRT